MATENGIKSKENVKDFGEVFTPDSIVNDMLTLVDNALKEENITPEQYIMKTYLEPSCGDGQFLVRILDRKLACIKIHIPKGQHELALIKALTTIYGVDIQSINVQTSKRRMLELIKTGTTKTFDLANKEIKSFTNLELEITPDLERVIQYILDKNIICGDTLGKSNTQEVLLTEFTWQGEQVLQKKYALSNLDIEQNFGRVDYMDYRNLGLNTEDEEDSDELSLDDF